MSRDPAEAIGGLNLIAFVRNDPLTGIDFVGRWFKHHGVVAVRSLFRGRELGKTWRRAVLLTTCWCDREVMKWRTVLIDFSVETEVWVRTHMVAQKLEDLQYIKRPKDAYNATVKHELLHVKHYRQWHDSAEPQVKRDFDGTVQVFDSLEECDTYRNKQVDKWRKSWNKICNQERQHTHADFRDGNDPSLDSGLTEDDWPEGYTRYSDDPTVKQDEDKEERFWVDVFR